MISDKEEHGLCYWRYSWLPRESRRLLELLHYDPATDRLIFLGDYIDRGPDSKGVLDLMLQLQRDNPANVFLMGNHEDNFLTYIQVCLTGRMTSANDWRTEPFFAGGGVATLASYLPICVIPMIRVYATLCLRSISRFSRPAVVLDQRDLYCSCTLACAPASHSNGNTPMISCVFAGLSSSPHSLGKCVIFGHTPFREVRRDVDKVGIDTGACYAMRDMASSLPFVYRPNRHSKWNRPSGFLYGL